MLSFYTVYSKSKVHKSDLASSYDEDFELIRDRFSLWAFLFGPLWFFAKRKWIIGSLISLVLIGLTVYAHRSGISPDAMSYVYLIISMYLGLESCSLSGLECRMLRWNLRNGVWAHSETEAALHHLEQHHLLKH